MSRDLNVSWWRRSLNYMFTLFVCGERWTNPAQSLGMHAGKESACVHLEFANQPCFLSYIVLYCIFITCVVKMNCIVLLLLP